MTFPLQSTVQNLLLKAVSAEAFERLRPHMTMEDLPLRQVLVEADSPTGQLCFLESGLASVVASSPDHETAEVGHV